MKRVAVVLAIVILCLSAAGVASAGATPSKTFSGQGIVIVQNTATTAMSVVTPTLPLTMGTDFQILVTVAPAVPIAGAQLDLSFDPAIVSVKSVTEGNLFNQDGAGTFFMPGKIGNGILSGVADVIMVPGQGEAKFGTLAIITFTPVSSGTSALKLSNIVVGDVSAQSLPFVSVDNQVTIN